MHDGLSKIRKMIRHRVWWCIVMIVAFYCFHFTFLTARTYGKTSKRHSTICKFNKFILFSFLCFQPISNSVIVRIIIHILSQFTGRKWSITIVFNYIIAKHRVLLPITCELFACYSDYFWFNHFELLVSTYCRRRHTCTAWP